MASYQAKAEIVQMEKDQGAVPYTGEKVEEAQQVEVEDAPTVAPRLDKHGLPLVPQPMQRKDDPLVGQEPASRLTQAFPPCPVC